MKLENTVHNVSANFDTSTTQCEVLAGAKLFDMLSAKLYVRPLEAVARELAANALDAHRDAGTLDTPFTITLPSAFNPNFIIRDYGTGMTDERVQTVWRRWLASDKNDSDSAIGGWGIGGKVGYHVADVFSITCWVDGVKNVYSAFKNDQGVPSIALLSTHETDEPNGVEIKIPVPTNKMGEFIAATEAGLRHFPKGSFIYTSGTEPKQVQYALKGSLCGIRKNIDYNHAPYVVMGPIGYQLDIHQVIDKIEDLAEESTGYPISEVRELLRSHARLDIFVPQGSVMPHPSREHLEYTERTNRALFMLLPHVVRELSELASTKLGLNSNVNLYDTIKSYREFDRSLPSYIIAKAGESVNLSARLDDVFDMGHRALSMANPGKFIKDVLKPDFRLLDVENYVYSGWETKTSFDFYAADPGNVLVVRLPEPPGSYGPKSRKEVFLRAWTKACEDDTIDLVYLVYFHTDAQRRAFNQLFAGRFQELPLSALPEVNLKDAPDDMFPSASAPIKGASVSTPTSLYTFDIGQTDADEVVHPLASTKIDNLSPWHYCWVETERKKVSPDDRDNLLFLKNWKSAIYNTHNCYINPTYCLERPANYLLEYHVIALQKSLPKYITKTIKEILPSLADVRGEFRRLVVEDHAFWDRLYVLVKLQNKGVSFDTLYNIDATLGRVIRRLFPSTPLTTLLDAYPSGERYLFDYNGLHLLFEDDMENRTCARSKCLDLEAERCFEQIKAVAAQYPLLFKALPLFGETRTRYSTYYGTPKLEPYLSSGPTSISITRYKKPLRHEILRYLRLAHPIT